MWFCKLFTITGEEEEEEEAEVRSAFGNLFLCAAQCLLELFSLITEFSREG
jgi:hypothetical protein